MKSNILLLSLITLLLASCGQRVKKERLARIDSLANYLPAVEGVLTEIDSQRIENQLAQIKETQDWLFDNVEDTLPKKSGLQVADYFRSEKYLRQSIQRYQGVGMELKYAKKQVEALRKDVKNSFYSDEEFEGYFKAEASAVAKLNDAAGELASKHHQIEDEHNRLRQASQQVLDSIKAIILSDKPI